MQKLLSNLSTRLSRITSNGKYFPLIDGLRFLAIMPVLVQHMSERLIQNTPIDFSTPVEHDQLAFLASRGTIGVFIFFALSGFMLSLPFAKHHLYGGKKVGLKNYFTRRFTRIEPPYLVWMTVFAVVLLVQGAWTFGELVPHWLASCFYLHNFIYGEYSVINPVAWSLEIEIQFYLIAPWLVGLFFRIKNDRKREWILLGSIFGFITLQHAMGWQYSPYKPTLLGQLPHFFVGIWLANRYLTSWKNTPSENIKWDFLFLPALLVMAYTWTEEYAKSLLFAVAMMTVFTAAFRGKIFSQILQNQWIALVGGMCYTIYLIHLPLMELQMKFTSHLTLTEHYIFNLFLQLAIGLPFILFASAMFFLLLEKPFMRKDWASRLLPEGGSFFIEKIKNAMKNIWTFFRRFKLETGASIFVIILFFLPKNITAQSQSDYLLPPLDTIIKLALEKSPKLKSQDVWMESRRKQADLESKSWADRIAVGGTALFGTNTVLDYQQTTVSSEQISVDRRSAVYNGGVTIRFTLGDVVNRDEKIHLKRLEYERASIDRRVLEDEIREEVLIRYDRFQASMAMLALEAENVEAMRLALEVSKKYFEAGNLPASEYTTTLSKYIAAQKLLEKTKMQIKHDHRMVLEMM